MIISPALQLRFEQIWQMAKVDFTKRYYGSQLGLLWAILEPVINLGVYYFAFAILVYRKADSMYAAYIFTGLISFKFFRVISNRSITLLRQKRYLIENIPFKRFDIFLATMITESISLGVSIVMYILFVQFIGVHHSFKVLELIPVFIVLALFSMGMGMILATISVFFRDINYIWDLGTVLLMWTSPVIIMEDVFLEMAPWIIYANPIVVLLSNFRAPLLYDSHINMHYFLISFIISSALFILGYLGIKKYSAKILEQ